MTSSFFSSSIVASFPSSAVPGLMSSANTEIVEMKR
jgi:hypothetical protein